MVGAEHTLIVLALILFLGLFIPEVFIRFKIPYVTPIIIMGAILGPNGLNLIQSDVTIEFFGFLGFTFLMFMAGLETSPTYIKDSWKKIMTLSLVNSIIPFGTGFLIGRAFSYDYLQSLIIATIFTASSVALVIPSIKNFTLFDKKTTQLVTSAVVVVDMISLLLFAMIFQDTNSSTRLPLPLHFLALFLIIILLKISLPKIASLFARKRIFKKNQEHEDQLRFIIIILITVLLIFSLFGIHPILAAFLVGLLLSNHVTSEKIYRQFHTLGYGLFIPVFFFIAGMEIDINIFMDFDSQKSILLFIIFGAIFSKLISGYLGGKIINLTTNDAFDFGIISMSHLTTTLAITYAAKTAGLLDSILSSAIIILAVVTTILVPSIFKLLDSYTSRKKRGNLGF